VTTPSRFIQSESC